MPRTLSGLSSGEFDQIDVLNSIHINGHPGLANTLMTSDGVNSSWDVLTSSHIGEGVVTSNKIAVDAVINEKIKDNAVTTGKILDSNVTTGKIAGNAVTTNKILDGNVTNAKLSHSTISNVALGGSLADLTAGSHITFSDGSTYNGGTAITIAAANDNDNTEYTGNPYGNIVIDGSNQISYTSNSLLVGKYGITTFDSVLRAKPPE